MLFGSTLIRTLCAEKSVLFDTVRIVFVLAMGCFYGEVRGVHPINLKCSLHSLLSFLSSSSVLIFPVSPFLFSFLPSHLFLPLFSSSAVTPTLHSGDQLEKAVHTLLICSHSLPCVLFLYFVHLLSLHFSFPRRFPLFNLIPLSSCAVSSPPIFCFFIFVRMRPFAYSNLSVPH